MADPARSAAALATGSLQTLARTLLVTNDFPPRSGGIQRYLLELATRLPAGGLAVYAPAWAASGANDQVIM